MSNARDKANIPALNFSSTGIDDNATSTAITIDSSENVGIGTTSPQRHLHIHASQPYLQLTSSGTGTTSLDGFQLICGQSGGEAILMQRENNKMTFYTNGTERFRISSGGNVGIGESSPDDKLHVNSGTQNDVAKFESTDTTASLILVDSATTTDGNRIQTIGDTMNLQTGGSEAMRIDASQNILMGKTSANTGTAGVEASPLGRIGATRSGNITGLFNRLSSDGEIVRFQKDGTTVGSIGNNGDNLGIESVDVGLLFLSGSSEIIPTGGNFGVSDNTKDLGRSTTRFKDLYLGGGLYVGGTGSANKLDDYEEGTWTGTISDGTNNATMSSNTGAYVKIGSLVVLTGYFVVSSLGSVSGNLRLTGLPFACGSSNSFYTSNGLAWGANLSITDDTSIGFQIDTNASHLNFTHWDNTSGTTLLQASQLTASGQFMMNLSYRTDA